MSEHHLIDFPWTPAELLDDVMTLRRTAIVLARDADYKADSPRGAALRLLRIKLVGMADRLERLMSDG